MSNKHDFKVDDRVKYGETYYRGVVTKVTEYSVFVVWGFEPNQVEYTLNSSGWKHILPDKPREESWFAYVLNSKHIIGPYASEKICLENMPFKIEPGHEFFLFKEPAKKYVIKRMAVEV